MEIYTLWQTASTYGCELSILPKMADEAAIYSQSDLEDTRQPLVLSVSITLLILTTVAIILRHISRRIAKIPWRSDDIFVALGWIFFSGLAALAIGTYTLPLSLHSFAHLD